MLEPMAAISKMTLIAFRLEKGTSRTWFNAHNELVEHVIVVLNIAHLDVYVSSFLRDNRNV